MILPKYTLFICQQNMIATKKWPIIYFFDPHGVGNLPLILYKDLAEKYGFIIAGTYNSKNGMQWEGGLKRLPGSLSTIPAGVLY